MAFQEVEQKPTFEGPFGHGKVTILGANGLRLSGLGSFHLDEGPDFAWLNIYRTLAAGRQLEITREREATVVMDGNGVLVRWDSCEAVEAELSARYEIVEAESAVDVVFSAELAQDYKNFELFIANYFTPYYTPRYAVTDHRTHPEGVFWYEKKWYAEGECESWARDEEAEAVFSDGRWLDGYPLNWRRGPFYAYPLMVQEHRHGGAIVLMARREDCFGISGFNAYHNSQYFHLWGKDVRAGERIEMAVRMVLMTDWDDLQEEALALYKSWMEG